MDDEQTVRWTPQVGSLLARGRGGLSKREAARRAGFSEATWRALELGVRRPARGVAIPVNPTVGTLISAADAVGVSRSDVLALVGIHHHDDTPPTPPSNDRLDEVERRLAALESAVFAIPDTRDFVVAAQGADVKTQTVTRKTTRPRPEPEPEST